MIKKYCVLLFIFLALVLSIFPKLDVAFSNLFYVFPLDFIHKKHPIVVMIFRLVPIITMVFAALCFIYLVYNFFRGKKLIASPAFYLLIAALLGPGLVVNSCLKEYYGRARPRDIIEFGGDKAFSSAIKISDQCDHNCSFTSGHAAMGYYFSSLSYVVPGPYKTLSFLIGILFGSVIGIGRVVQGAHFLSDVIYSGLIIMLVNHLCFLFWKKIQYKVKKKRK